MYYIEHLTYKKWLNMLFRDETGKIVYRVKEKATLFSKTAPLEDASGKVTATVNQLPGITPRFKIVCAGGNSFYVTQKFSFRPTFTVTGIKATVTGHIYDTNYIITIDGSKVVHCWRELRNGDYIKIVEILAGQYAIQGFAIVTAIESAGRALFMATK